MLRPLLPDRAMVSPRTTFCPRFTLKLFTHMEVELVNDGPVTILLDTDQLMYEPRR